MPTETVYGLAGAAFNTEALAKIFAAKERPTFDPLIVHVFWDIHASAGGGNFLENLEALDLISVSSLQLSARDAAQKLLAAFWPGPFTLVLPKSLSVPDLATSGLGSVALRMPAHPVAQKLILEAGTPLAAPSANRFGRISPTRAEHVMSELGGRIAMVLDGGPCQVGVESTILQIFGDGRVRLLRPGGTPLSRIEEVLGRKLDPAELGVSSSAPGTEVNGPGAAQAAPGMLESHYAPRKPLILLPAPLDQLSGDEVRALSAKVRPGTPVGLLAQKGEARQLRTQLEALFGAQVADCRVLSAGGDLGEAARNLFSAMRELDNSAASILLAEPCSAGNEGLGYAIQDRLKRASHS